MSKPLNRVLVEEPYRFEFFQAVRLFERLFAGKKPVGGSALPAEESIRFRSRIALDFPASEIHEIREPADEDGNLEMLVNFMGMVGVSGVLPTHSGTGARGARRRSRRHGKPASAWGILGNVVRVF